MIQIPKPLVLVTIHCWLLINQKRMLVFTDQCFNGARTYIYGAPNRLLKYIPHIYPVPRQVNNYQLFNRIGYNYI